MPKLESTLGITRCHRPSQLSMENEPENDLHGNWADTTVKNFSAINGYHLLDLTGTPVIGFGAGVYCPVMLISTIEYLLFGTQQSLMKALRIHIVQMKKDGSPFLKDNYDGPMIFIFPIRHWC